MPALTSQQFCVTTDTEGCPAPVQVVQWLWEVVPLPFEGAWGVGDHDWWCGGEVKKVMEPLLPHPHWHDDHGTCPLLEQEA